MSQTNSAKKGENQERLKTFGQHFPDGYESFLEDNKALLKISQGQPCVHCEFCKKTYKSAQETITHLNSREHCIMKDKKQFLGLMQRIPPITESHRKALDDALSSVDGGFIDQSEIERRIECANKYCRALESRIPGLRMNPFGNFLLGLSSPSSPILLNAAYDSLSNSESRNADGWPGDPEGGSIFLELYNIISGFKKHPNQPPLPKSDQVSFARDCVFFRMVDSRGNLQIKISGRSPHHVDLAPLIRTYQAVDYRAKRLTELLIVFVRMANLHEVFQTPALCIMVIFFLQHTSPPLLPNLHDLARKYQDTISVKSVAKVMTKGEDLSYLNDLAVLPKFFTPMDEFSLADLWLKLLRFYVCEFQRRDYLISIVHSEPVKKSIRKVKSQVLFVEDPFYPGTSLINDMNIYVDKFFHEQILAAYVYFGIPRLKGSSRPLFTKMTMEHSKSLKKTFSLGSDSNQKFILTPVPPAELKSRLDRVSSAVCNSHSDRRLEDVVLEVLQQALSEICPPNFTLDIKWSLGLSPHNLMHPYATDVRLSASQAAEFARMCCQNLWTTARIDLLGGASKVQLLVLAINVLRKTLGSMAFITPTTEGKEDLNASLLPEIAETMDILGSEENDRELSLKEEKGVNRDGFEQHKIIEKVCEDMVPSDNQAGSPSDWEKCILVQDTYQYVIWDSERPDFYNSTIVQKLKPDDLAFPFKANPPSPSQFIGSSIIAHTEPPPLGCSNCDTTSHLSSECPATNLEYWRNLESSIPRVTSNLHFNELSDCFVELAEYHKLSREMSARHQRVVKQLTDLFRSTYPDISLELFGSCANGFETKTSDVDICVVFPADSLFFSCLLYGTCNEKTKLLKNFKKLLFRRSQSLGISNIRPVFHAKVPIIKFLVNEGIEVDLSFSNYLAIHNTRMLRSYNSYEPRLRVLNTVLKVVLKSYGIPKSCDGGISSYAYAIMLIHYLQQKGYLPCLQEIYESKYRPQNIVNNWNAWYQTDEEIVKRHWRPQNDDTTIAELWFGFLRYFLFEFDRNIYEVTIDTKKLTQRRSSTNSLVIKDPFDLSHNMTQFVHDRLIIRILKTFYNVLLHHSTSIRMNMNIDTWKQSLFSPLELLTNSDSLSQRRGRKHKNRTNKPTSVVATPSTAVITCVDPNRASVAPVINHIRSIDYPNRINVTVHRNGVRMVTFGAANKPNDTTLSYQSPLPLQLAPQILVNPVLVGLPPRGPGLRGGFYGGRGTASHRDGTRRNFGRGFTSSTHGAKGL